MKQIAYTFFLFGYLGTNAQPLVSVKKDSIGANTITYQTTCYDIGKSDNSVIFINVHENENTSVLAAKQVLDTAKKYCVVQLRHRGIRFVTFSFKGKTFTIDPNRIFTTKGALASLKKNSHSYKDDIYTAAAKEVNRLATNYTINYIDRKKLVVALHNNTNGEPLSIISYKSGSEEKNATDVYMNLHQDPDDFFFTTDKNIFDFLKQKGFNVALQNNALVVDDGSLSVYAGKKSIPYVNIEAQVGHLSEQRKMIEVVLEYLNVKNL